MPAGVFQSPNAIESRGEPMRTRIPRWPVLLAAALLALVAAGPARAATFVGLTQDNQLIQFDGASPGSPSAPIQITGTQGNETMLGIDFRPATGQLYALGSTCTVYRIDPATGVATPVAPSSFAIPGNSFGFDFNPVVDRIRVVSDFDGNGLVDPNNGTNAPGPNLTYGTENPNIVAAAYSNNVAAAPSTVLYGIDHALNALMRQNESTGELTLVGPLGVDPGEHIGFDIAPDGSAYFVSGPFFHGVNLQTGAAPSLGTLPVPLKGLAVVLPAGGGPPDGGGPPPGGGGPPGDYNLDGAVDAADYVVWRKGALSEDGLRVRIQTPDGVLEGDTMQLYSEWRANFGRSSASQRRRARGIVFARNRTTLRGEQSKRVRVRLTKAGKRLVRRYDRKRLRARLLLRVTYRPASGGPVQRRAFRQAVRLRVVKPRR
jgi:hypothetical protein